MSSKHSRRYSPQFKREAVELYRRSGKSIVVIATEIDVEPESLRKWIRQQETETLRARVGRRPAACV